VSYVVGKLFFEFSLKFIIVHPCAWFRRIVVYGDANQAMDAPVTR
jgi:hypothetical protein